jgi:hypothetical protein
MLAGGGRLDILDRREHRHGAVINRLSDVGQAHAASGSLQQAHAQLLFQLGKGAAQAGLVAAKRLGSSGETSALNDFDEGREAGQVHTVGIIGNSLEEVSRFIAG